MTPAISWMIVAALAGNPEPAGGWTSFRNGGLAEAAGPALPIKWSPQEAIAWQNELPGYGQSSPVISQGTVYVTAVDGPQKESCLVLALEAASGREIWRQSITASTGLPSNYSVARAAPTPVADEQGVIAFFEGGDIVALDVQGKIRWQRSLTKDYGEFDNHHGLGSSPAQTASRLVINVQHRGPSYIVCLDKKTGETAWKMPRKSSMSWSSPIVFEHAGVELAVVSSTGTVQAYRMDTGEQAWSLEELSGNSVPSPVWDGSRLYIGASQTDFETASNAARSNACFSLTPTGCELRWRAERALCDYASPTLCGSQIYYVNRAGVLYCLDRETGAERFARRMSGGCWATPIVQQDRVYLFGKNGVTTVLESGAEWNELSQNSLWNLDQPPKPEKYVETRGGRGHGEGGGGPAGEARGGLAAMLFKHDQNQDGRLESAELPDEFRKMLIQGDKNGDQALDKEEVAAMSEEFRKRRASSREDSRDPILYGAAAAEGRLILRTGTRLYAVGPASAVQEE